MDPARRRVVARARGESGFALAEVVIAMTLFLLIAIGLEATLASGVAGHRVARERTVAEQFVTDHLETIRRLPYDSVGTVGGNPPGVIVARQNLTVSGFPLTVRTRITYVDDPLPGGYITRANYKRVLVVVTETATGRLLARHETYVAPPTQPLRNRALIRAQVVDFALNAGVPDATVMLETGPSAPRTDTTEPDGIVNFPQLLPNPASGPQQYYDLRVAVPGYVTLRDDVPPGAAAHVQLAPGQAFTTSLRIYRPATIFVFLQDSRGDPYVGTATVTIGSTRAAESFTVTGGQLTVTQLGGEPVVPGLQYTVSAYTTVGGPGPPGAEQRLLDLAAQLQAIIDANPGTPLADKMEDALAKVQDAILELRENPPDAAGAIGKIQGAIDDIQAAIDAGLLPRPQGQALINELNAIIREIQNPTPPPPPGSALFAPSVTQTVPNAYPTDLTSTFTLRLLQHTTAQVEARVRDGGNPVVGGRVDVTGGPGAIFLSGTTNTGGIALFTVPRGPGYTLTAIAPNGKRGQATTAVPGPGTQIVFIAVS